MLIYMYIHTVCVYKNPSLLNGDEKINAKLWKQEVAIEDNSTIMQTLSLTLQGGLLTFIHYIVGIIPLLEIVHPYTNIQTLRTHVSLI